MRKKEINIGDKLLFCPGTTTLHADPLSFLHNYRRIHVHVAGVLTFAYVAGIESVFDPWPFLSGKKGKGEGEMSSASSLFDSSRAAT